MHVPKMTFLLVRKTLFFAFVVALIFVAGYSLGRTGFTAEVREYPHVTINRDLPPDKRELDFSLFWTVWDTLDAKYYDKDKLVKSKMVYGAIHGMVSALEDPYTVFLPPTENKAIEDDLHGGFEGIGIQIELKDSRLVVIKPLPETPAEKAGVKAGDYILRIQDESKKVDKLTEGISLPEAVDLIKGKKGSTVKLTLLRENSEEPIVIDVVRNEIDVPSIVVNYLGENESIAQIAVLKFSGDTKSEWDEKVAEIMGKSSVSKVILDLRYNPGGYLQAAVDLAGDFLDNDKVVVIEEVGKSRQEYKSAGIPRLKNYDVLVLINEGSASASEILAGALRDQKKIKLVGDKTFGKGTIQEPMQNEDGSGLHITIAKWLTPSGYWVHKNGLEPDVLIEDNPDTEEDEQLDEAVRLMS